MYILTDLRPTTVGQQLVRFMLRLNLFTAADDVSGRSYDCTGAPTLTIHV